MLVRFEGGPLGGEERNIPDDTGLRYKIPVIRRRSLSYRRDLDTRLPAPGLDPCEIQEYEYDGEVYPTVGGVRVRRYRWVDPYEGLRERIDKLMATIRRQEEVIAELEDRPADLNEAVAAAVRKALREAFA